MKQQQQHQQQHLQQHQQRHQQQRKRRRLKMSTSISTSSLLWSSILVLIGINMNMNMNMNMNHSYDMRCSLSLLPLPVSTAFTFASTSTSTSTSFAFPISRPSLSFEFPISLSPHSYRKQQLKFTTTSSSFKLKAHVNDNDNEDDNNANHDNDDDHDDNDNGNTAAAMGNNSNNRRALLMMMASTATAVASSQSASAAIDLENIGIGRGTWLNQNENNGNEKNDSATVTDAFDTTSTTPPSLPQSLPPHIPLPIPIPTSFITYMTRFLINYDATIHSWWYDDILYKYSLLPSSSSSSSSSSSLPFDDEGPLTSNFASMAKSIELSLVEYITSTANNQGQGQGQGQGLSPSVSSNSNSNSNSISINDYESIQNRFESLLSLFVTTYVQANDNNNNNNNNNNNALVDGRPIEIKAGETDTTTSMGEMIQQIVLLFTLLPSQYQPVRGLKSLLSSLPTNDSSTSTSSSTNSRNININTNTSPLEYNTDLTKLLPTDIYSTNYDSSKEVYTIYPSIDNQQIPQPTTYDNTNSNNGSSGNIYTNTNTNTNANTPYQSTSIFGPISNKPLKRQRPNLSFDTYALLGLCGATGCALTHSVVIPFDVVKTRLQTNPDQYKNLIDGVISISQEGDTSSSTGTNTGDAGGGGGGGGGWKTFLLGSQATIAGYFWYGLSVYPCYSFSKWYMEHVLFDPPTAVIYANLISLIAGAIAAVVASVGLTPIEAARIRTVAEPGVYRELGLVGTLQYMAAEGEEQQGGNEGEGVGVGVGGFVGDFGGGFKTLYAGFPSLVTRQVIFGSVKFLAFERACEALFAAFPSLHETTATALGVSLVAGALSGALSSVISQPADSILTYVAKNKVDNASVGVFDGGMLMVEREGLGSLYRGLGSRCLWASAIISGQFFLYDIFRSLLGINSEDLMQVFRLLLTSE